VSPTPVPRRPGTDVTGAITVGRLHELSDGELEDAKRWRAPGEDPAARLSDIYAEQQRRAADRLTRATLRLARWNMVVAIVAVLVAVSLGIVQLATR
jgi:hypothetical protein